MELYYHATDRDVLILSADGGIDSVSAEELVSDLETLVAAGARKLIVDCSRLGFISSYGIAVLVRLHKKLAERGGDVKLAALESRVARLIALVGLERVFQIYTTVDDARNAFRSGS
jgi:anti-sigma B factor antagonist